MLWLITLYETPWDLKGLGPHDKSHWTNANKYQFMIGPIPPILSQLSYGRWSQIRDRIPLLVKNILKFWNLAPAGKYSSTKGPKCQEACKNSMVPCYPWDPFKIPLKSNTFVIEFNTNFRYREFQCQNTTIQLINIKVPWTLITWGYIVADSPWQRISNLSSEILCSWLAAAITLGTLGPFNL